MQLLINFVRVGGVDGWRVSLRHHDTHLAGAAHFWGVTESVSAAHFWGIAESASQRPLTGRNGQVRTEAQTK